ncbi:MAG: hypothetical protein [Bacteriophage sp.]|nr:MAG: hypothetical protein [Bacteriophage sp.]
MEEIWKDIDGFKGYYQVSNLGRVKSIGRSGKGCSIVDRIKKVTPSKDGIHYPNFGASTPFNKNKTLMLHRVIAIAFIPNPYNKKEVNHIDGDKNNNSLCNLEWVTSSENTNHGLKLGIMNTARGEQKIKQSKLKENQVKEILLHLKNGVPGAHIAKKCNVNKVTIYSIKNGKSWKHIKI